MDVRSLGEEPAEMMARCLFLSPPFCLPFASPRLPFTKCGLLECFLGGGSRATCLSTVPLSTVIFRD
eukprot:7302038-Pyramimonas_sp.AAC.1